MYNQIIHFLDPLNTLTLIVLFFSVYMLAIKNNPAISLLNFFVLSTLIHFIRPEAYTQIYIPINRENTIQVFNNKIKDAPLLEMRIAKKYSSYQEWEEMEEVNNILQNTNCYLSSDSVNKFNSIKFQNVQIHCYKKTIEETPSSKNLVASIKLNSDPFIDGDIKTNNVVPYLGLFADIIANYMDYRYITFTDSAPSVKIFEENL